MALFPSSYVQNLTAPLRNPTGIWADFEPSRKLWIKLQGWVFDGLMDPSDLPPEPDPANYPDKVSARTMDVVWAGVATPRMP